MHRHGARKRTIHGLQCWPRERRGWAASSDHDGIGRQCRAGRDYFPADRKAVGGTPSTYGVHTFYLCNRYL